MVAEALEVRRAIGVVFQDSVLDQDFTGAENLWLHARLWRVPDARRRIDALLAAVDLADRSDHGVRTYSGGMRRRLEIARALLAGPRLMFLDEPTLGLDPIVRRNLWELVKVLRESQRVTIMLSTHYLEEAADVCDRVAIIDHGAIIAQGSPQALVTELGDQIVELRTSGADHAELISRLTALDRGLDNLLQSASTVAIPARDSAREVTERINALPLSELGVTAMTVRPATLNDVFLHLTARSGGLAMAVAA